MHAPFQVAFGKMKNLKLARFSLYCVICDKCCIYIKRCIKKEKENMINTACIKKKIK